MKYFIIIFLFIVNISAFSQEKTPNNGEMVTTQWEFIPKSIGDGIGGIGAIANFGINAIGAIADVGIDFVTDVGLVPTLAIATGVGAISVVFPVSGPITLCFIGLGGVVSIALISPSVIPYNIANYASKTSLIACFISCFAAIVTEQLDLSGARANRAALIAALQAEIAAERAAVAAATAAAEIVATIR